MLHKHSLKKGTRDQWEVTETVEFVNQLKKRHIQDSSVIADYLNKKMISGARFGFTEYQAFENFVRTKYGPQMKELDKMYRPEDLTIYPESSPALEVSDAGVITVAD